MQILHNCDKTKLFQVGKYLASQSDDKSVRVWRTSDWTQEAIITEPFVKCGGIF